MLALCTENQCENSLIPNSRVCINVNQDSLDPAAIHPLEAYKYREYLYKTQQIHDPKWDTLDEESTDLYVERDIDLEQHCDFLPYYSYKTQDFEKADSCDFGLHIVLPILSLSIIGLHKHLYDKTVYLTGIHRKAIYTRT